MIYVVVVDVVVLVVVVGVEILVVVDVVVYVAPRGVHITGKCTFELPCDGDLVYWYDLSNCCWVCWARDAREGIQDCWGKDKENMEND